MKPHIFSGRNGLLDRRDARLRAGVGEVGEEKKQEEGAVVVVHLPTKASRNCTTALNDSIFTFVSDV